MRHQLGGQLADAIALEAAFPNEVGPARQIERDLGLGLIHGEQKSVARDAVLVAERLAQRRSQREGAILDGVMLVDVQIAGAGELEREAAVLGDLFEHVIEKSQAGRDAARSLARQVELDRDVGFLGSPAHLRAASGAQDARRDGGPGLVRRRRRGVRAAR